MKTYMGEHFGLDGVTVSTDGGKGKQLDPRFDLLRKWADGFAWGKYLDPKIAHLPLALAQLPIHPGALQLAFAILVDYTGSVDIARRAYVRFAYRTTGTFNANGPFVLAGPDIELQLNMMEAIEGEDWTRQQKDLAARARPVTVTEYGADVVWDKFDGPRINKPVREE